MTLRFTPEEIAAAKAETEEARKRAVAAGFRVFAPSAGGDTEDTEHTETQSAQGTQSTQPPLQGIASSVSPPGEVEFLNAISVVAGRYPAPEEALYHVRQMRQLVSICHALQLSAGSRPFYLGCRDAGRLLGVEFQVAARYLRRLVHDEVLEVVSVGLKSTGRASQYRYKGGGL